MSDTSNLLILRNFSGEITVTPDAVELKRSALALAAPILKVETEKEQSLAVAALRELKAIRVGIEGTRKSVKNPVLELGKRIDRTASDFIADAEKEELRLQGLVNHYQRKILDEQRVEQERIRREQAEAERLEAEAKRKREQAEKSNDEDLKREADKLEAEAINKSMATEFSDSALAVSKPKGLVVREKVDFKVKDPILFVQAYPQFFKWNPGTESLKLDRIGILEELNKERGIFRQTIFPEELSSSKNAPELVNPIGLEVFHSVKSHVR